jgi:hypothetical protein
VYFIFIISRVLFSSNTLFLIIALFGLELARKAFCCTCAIKMSKSQVKILSPSSQLGPGRYEYRDKETKHERGFNVFRKTALMLETNIIMLSSSHIFSKLYHTIQLILFFFVPQFHDYDLVSSLQIPNGPGRGDGRVMRPTMTH